MCVATATAASPDGLSWVVTAAEKSKYDITFNTVDLDKDGFVTGAEVMSIFMMSKLPKS